MPIEETDGVRAARERMDANRDGKTDLADLKIHASGLRSTIIDLFGMILWVSLALGMLSVVWQLVTLSIGGAISTFVSTIVTVGVGFVVLDIRERLLARGSI